MILLCALFLGSAVCSSVQITVSATYGDSYGDLEVRMDPAIVFATKFPSFKQAVDLNVDCAPAEVGVWKTSVAQLHDHYDESMTGLRDQIFAAIFESGQAPSQQQIQGFHQQILHLSASLSTEYSGLMGREIPAQQVLGWAAEFFLPRLSASVQHFGPTPTFNGVAPVELKKYDLRMTDAADVSIADFYALVHFAQRLRRIARGN